VPEPTIGVVGATGAVGTVTLELLEREGYEPTVVDDEIALRNCPFHALAQEHRALVCGMNCDFLGGVIDGLDATDAFTARLAPSDGYCCVRIDVR